MTPVAHHSATHRFEKHARTVTALTFVSRVTGLARDAALSRVFGLSPLIDAFWFAFLLPNLFRRLFGEGALSAAFLPEYSRLDRDDPAVARQLATLTVGLLIIALGGLTLLAECVLLALSMRAGHANLVIWLMMVMLPYMPMVCLVAILGAMLQVHHRFGPTAAAPIILNLCIVVAAAGGAALLAPGESQRQIAHIGLVAGSVIVAGIVQVLWSLAALRADPTSSNTRMGTPGRGWWVGLRNTASARGPMRRVMAQVWPMLIGLGVLQLNTFVDGVIASYPTAIGPKILGYDFPLQTGAMASISFAQRLYEFPLGVFGIAVATAIFPALSRVADVDEAFGDILRRGLRLVVYIGLPASIGLMLVRQPLTAAVLQGREFSPEDTHRVARVLMGYAPAIWAYSMTHTLTRAFYAKGDSLTPVKVAAGMVLLNFALNVTLIWTPLKEAGLAWSTALCAVVQVLVLLRLIRRHVDRLIDRAVIASWVRTGLLTVLMGSVVWMVDWSLLSHRLPTWGWSLITLSVLVVSGGVIVVLASMALRMPELAWALGRSAAIDRAKA